MKLGSAVFFLVAIFALPLQAREAIAAIKIPFPFVAGGKVLPPGSYQFTLDDEATRLSVVNLETMQHVTMPVLGRLDLEPGHRVSVTFDRVGKDKFLESVRSAQSDGYLLRATPQDRRSDEIDFGIRYRMLMFGSLTWQRLSHLIGR